MNPHSPVHVQGLGQLEEPPKKTPAVRENAGGHKEFNDLHFDKVGEDYRDSRLRLQGH